MWWEDKSPNASIPTYRYGGIALGDSITAQHPGCAVISMYQRGMPLLRNMGVSGNTTLDVIARLDTVMALNPYEVTLQIGTNDWLGSVAKELVTARVIQIYQTLVDSGARVHLVIPPPADSAGLIDDVYDGRMHLKLSLLELGITYYEPWEQFVDASTGGWLAGASVDGVHPTWATRITAGETLATMIAANVGSNATVLAAMNNGVFTNPLFLADSAGVATGLTSIPQSGVVFTCATKAGVLGRAQVVTGSSAIRAAGPGFHFTPSVLPNRRYLVSMKCNPLSTDSTMGIDVNATCFNGGTLLTTTPAAVRWRITSGKFYNVSFIVDTPPDTTIMQVLVRGYPDSGSVASSCAFEVGQAQIFLLP